MNKDAANGDNADRPVGDRLDAEHRPPDVKGYEILRELLRDEASVTYLGRHLASGRNVAVRVVSDGAARSERGRARLEARIDAIETVKHVDVSPVLDVTVDANGDPAVVTEYSAGVSLRDYVGGEDPSLDETVDLTLRVCEPVMAAHQRGVVHQDVRPETVLVTVSGIPKLVNFRLPGCSEDSLPPADVRADVRAMGLLLYELLTGRNVSEASQREACCGPDGALRAPSAVWSPDAGVATGGRGGSVRRRHCPIDGDLDAIVLKAAAESPEDRYSTLTEFANDLVRWRNDRPVHAREATATDRLGKAYRRHRVAICSATLVGVALSGAALVQWPWATVYAFSTIVAAGLCLLYVQNQGRRGAAEGALARALDRIGEARAQAASARDFAARAEAARRNTERDIERIECKLRAAEGERDAQIELRQRAVRCAEDAERAYDLAEDQRDFSETRRAEAEAARKDEVARRTQAEQKTAEAVQARHQAEAKLAQTELQLAEAQSRAAVATEARDGAMQARQHAEERADRADRACREAQSQLHILTANMEAELHARRQAEARLLEAQRRAEDLADRLREAEQRADRVCRDQAETSRALDAVRAELVEMTGHRQRAEAALKQEAAQGEHAERRCAAAQVEADALGAKLADLGRKLAAETQVRNAMENQVADAALELREAHEALARIEGEKARLESQLAQFRSAEEARRAASEAIQGSAAEARLEAQRYAQAAEGENQRLRETIGALKRTSYFTLIALAQVAYERNELGYMNDLLAQCPQHLRGEDWNYLQWLATRTVRVFSGHDGQVLTAGFSPDGRRVFSGGYDHTLRLWDAGSGQAVGVLAGHAERVLTGAYSPDGTMLASGGADQTLRLWDAETAESIRVVSQANSAVTAVAFSADGSRLAAGTWSGELALWDPHGGQQVLTLAGHDAVVTAVAFSSDGTRLFSAGGDNCVRVWDLTDGREIRCLTGHADCVYDLALAPDGSRLASASADKTVRVWTVSDGRLVHQFNGHQKKVAAVAYGAGGDWIVSGSWDGTLKVWDVGSGRERYTLRGHTGGVNSVAVSADGTSIVSGSTDKTVRLWDAASVLDPWPVQVETLDAGAESGPHFPEASVQKPAIQLKPLVEIPIAGSADDSEEASEALSLDDLKIDGRDGEVEGKSESADEGLADEDLTDEDLTNKNPADDASDPSSLIDPFGDRSGGEDSRRRWDDRGFCSED